MRTKKDFKQITYLEHAFFKGCGTSESKYLFADILFPEGWQVDEQYLTKTGLPRIGKSDTIDRKLLDFTIRSNSRLDGKCQLEYLCDFYNKGIPLQKLREYSETKEFIKAIGFTGKNRVIGEILNPDQLRKLHQTWLLKNSYWSITEKAIEYEMRNDWALSYMYENGVDVERYEEAKSKYIQSQAKPKKYRTA